MAIQHLEDAAQVQLPAATKLVLMAIADDANRETRIAYPGAAKMMLWAGIGESRVSSVLQELICRQLIARRAKAYRGRRSEYIIFPTPEEIALLDDLDETLNHVSQTTIDRVKRQDEAAAQTKTASDQPVDNADEWVAPVRPISGERVVREHGMGRTGTTPPVRNSRVNHQSSSQSHHTGAVDNQQDGRSNLIHPTPGDVRHKELDLEAVELANAMDLAAIGIDEDGIRDLCTMILGRAKSHVVDPTSYVIHALTRNRSEWMHHAMEIAANRRAGRSF
ncbi:hypothetical protein [Agromyces sp. SYSU T00194]|uniref:hypothetical protein n=1 Tax=Agromyces chitinivorans TaxID=3158560 RepID=UPI00339ADFC5